MRTLWTITLLFAPLASATDLKVGFGATCSCPALDFTPSFVEASLFSLGDHTTLHAGASGQGLWAGANTTFDLGVAGNVNAGFQARYAWTQQYRLEGSLSGVLGSKATLNLQTHYGSAPLTQFDRLQAFTLEAEPEKAGFGLQLEGKYRLDRQWTLAAETALGTENLVQLGVQNRTGQDESRFAAVWRNNNRGSLFGATAGVTWREESSTLTFDALIGMQSQQLVWGGKLSVAAFELEDFFNSDVKVFAAYEPYRDLLNPLRYGFETLTPLDQGQIALGAYFTPSGYALQASYRFTLDPEQETEETLNE